MYDSENGPDGVEKAKRLTRMFANWNARLLHAAAAHYSTAARFDFRDKALSVLNAIAAISVLSLSANTDLQELIWKLFPPGAGKAILVPGLSLFVVLSSLCQYLLRYASRAERHKQAANDLSNLRRKIERYWSKGNLHPEAVHNLNRSYNMVVRSTPMVPSKIWENARWAKRCEIADINRQFFGMSREDDT